MNTPENSNYIATDKSFINMLESNIVMYGITNVLRMIELICLDKSCTTRKNKADIYYRVAKHLSSITIDESIIKPETKDNQELKHLDLLARQLQEFREYHETMVSTSNDNNEALSRTVDALVNEIKTFESDTFSASANDLTDTEARLIAASRVKVTWFDGIMLSELLEDIRDTEDND